MAAGSIDEWFHHIKQSFLSGDTVPRPRHTVCIYRVPKCLVDNKKEAHVPRLVQLGPYHDRVNCARHYSEMENHKLRAMREMVSRSGRDINFVIAKIQQLEARIRKCYDEEINCSGESLAWMFALDGCFILEFLRSHFQIGGSQNLDYFEPIFDPNRIGFGQGGLILSDITMLENQIPLFVLRKLLQLEMSSSPQDEVEKVCQRSFGSLILEVSPFNFGSDWPEVVFKHMEDAGHLLDLLRRSIIESCYRSGPTGVYFDTQICGMCIPSAEKLTRVGIGFEVSPQGQYGIGFRKNKLFLGTICLPRMLVSDSTDTILRNIVAFEECQGYYEEHIISRYVSLMHDLIGTAKDVEVLEKARIISSSLESHDKVAQLFNHFGKGMTIEPIEGIDQFVKDVNENYYSRFTMLRMRFHVSLAEFIEAKCAKPWMALSMVGAILILVMTAMQVYYSAMQVYNPAH